MNLVNILIILYYMIMTLVVLLIFFMAITDRIDAIYCPVCGGRFTILYNRRWKDTITIKCRDCGALVTVLEEDLYV